MQYPIKIPPQFPQNINFDDVVIKNIEQLRTELKGQIKIEKPFYPYRPSKNYVPGYNRAVNGYYKSSEIMFIVGVGLTLFFLILLIITETWTAFTFLWISGFATYVMTKDDFKHLFSSQMIIKQQRRFNADHNIETVKYEREVEQYYKELDIYNEKLSIEEKRIENQISTFKKKNQKKFFNEFLSRIDNYLLTAKPFVVADKDVQKGISENYFKEVLVSNFGDKILLKCKVDYYYPDFVYYDKKHNLYIDIEIDEPYVGASKEIIHYHNIETEYYSDESRNEYISAIGWGIIRFSEKQVVEYPEECCIEIEDFVNSICYPKNPESFLVYKSFVPKEKVWCSKTADEMAMMDFRKSYLNKLNIKGFG